MYWVFKRKKTGGHNAELQPAKVLNLICFSTFLKGNTLEKSIKNGRNFPKISEKLFFCVKTSYKSYKVSTHYAACIARPKQKYSVGPGL